MIWSQKWDRYSKDEVQNEVKRLIYLYENDTNFMKIVDELSSVSTDLNNYLENYAKYEDKLKERLFPKQKSK